MQAITEFFEESVNKFPDNIYLWDKQNGQYQGMTYKETREQVYRFAAGLMSLGIRKGDRIALIAEGRNAWVISELGILYAGGINVPMSVKLNEPEDLKFRLDHSESRFVIASGNQAKKIRDIKSELTSFEKLIVLDQSDNIDKKSEVLLDEVLLLGDEYLENNSEEFINRWKGIKGDDPANICYTSGTTADPKGIILSHNNYTANVKQSYSLMDIPPYYRTLLILPWDHAFAHTAGIYCFMGKGASIASIELGKTPMETLKNIPKNIKEIKPHILMSVPALAKNFRKNIEKGIKNKGGMAEKLFNHALKISYKYNGIGWDKGKRGKINKSLIKFYDKLLFSKVREGFGGELKFFIGGGALLDIEFQKFFFALGIPMFQGYGLTEASPVISSNSEMKQKLGSSGYLVTDLKLKILDEKGNELKTGEKGEIVVRGENVMLGYWKNEEATKETIKDGWLYTGDLGYMDDDGFLYVLGRFKSLLISDDGEKFSPEGIEEAIVGNSSIIDQCMLYNNQNPYTVILVYPNKETIKRQLKEKGIELNTEKAVELTVQLIEKEINEYRKNGVYENMFPQRWIPSTIGVLSEGFTEENQLLNSTLKIVRGKILEKYKGLIEFLYTTEAKKVINQKNIAAIKLLLDS
ncbi:AMP-dependent synthetase/ligase [Bacteroidota bacterium]